MLISQMRKLRLRTQSLSKVIRSDFRAHAPHHSTTPPPVNTDMCGIHPCSQLSPAPPFNQGLLTLFLQGQPGEFPPY